MMQIPKTPVAESRRRTAIRNHYHPKPAKRHYYSAKAAKSELVLRAVDGSLQNATPHIPQEIRLFTILEQVMATKSAMDGTT